MNKWLTGFLGAGFPALLVLFAMHGEKFAASMGASFDFLFKLTTDAPFGLASFVLALGVAVAAQAFAARFAAQLPCPRSAELCTALLGLVAGFAAMYAQLPTVRGMLLAIMAGCGSPFVYLAIAAAVGAIRRKGATP